jgi:predicted nucleic acid-binding Zn ribbon protein
MEEYIARETEPTMLPGTEADDVPVGRCAVCGKAIYGDERVVSLDNGVMVHEDCAVFRRESLTEFLDLLGLDYYVDKAKDVADDE